MQAINLYIQKGVLTWRVFGFHTTTLLVLLATQTFFIQSVCFGQEADKLANIHNIMKAWEIHADLIRSARFTFLKRQEIPRSVIADIPLELIQGGESAPPMSRKGIHASETTCTFLLEGDKMRFEMKGNIPSRTSSTELNSIHQTSVWNGFIFKQYIPTAGGKEHRQGVLGQGQNGIIQEPSILPLLLNLRPNLIKTPMVKYSVAPSKPEKDGPGLLMLTEPNLGDKNPIVRRFWVDPAKDYAIVRYMETVSKTSALLLQVDLVLFLEPDNGWIPTAWTRIIPVPNNPAHAIDTVTVTESKINLAVENSDFDLFFPTGTILLDPNGNRIGPDMENKSLSKNTLYLIVGFTLIGGVLVLKIFQRRLKNKSSRIN